MTLEKTRKTKLMDEFLFDVLAELNVPHTDEILCEYMQDPEKVQEAYEELLARIECYFEKNYGVRTLRMKKEG